MMNDVYYSPEKFGLTPLGDIDFSDGCYQFDLTAVWRDATGKLLWADDAGCSCPSPFESVGIDDLSTGTPAELQAHLEKRNTEGYDGDRSDAIAELMGRVVGA